MAAKAEAEAEAETVASAPGKVLMVGGYLVLQRPHFGLVLSSPARFYALVHPLPTPQRNPGEAVGQAADCTGRHAGERGRDSVLLRVRSPQMGTENSFRVTVPSMALSVAPGEGQSQQQINRNPFVERAAQLALAVALFQQQQQQGPEALQVQTELPPELPEDVEVVLLGDNDFYSHRHTLEALGLPISAASLASLPRFSPVAGTSSNSQGAALAAKVEKTGLGSSAAMTAAVCGALLRRWGVISAELTERERALVHRVAQAAHCWGQGKVGSGFDIAAAVFGPVKYVRFSPGFLEPLMAHGDAAGSPESGGASGDFRTGSTPEWMRLGGSLCGSCGPRPGLGSSGVGAAADAAGVAGREVLAPEFWDFVAEPFALPPGLHLMVGETGGGGTSTPSMLSAIRRWQEENPEESASVWGRLASANASVAEGLRKLQVLAAEKGREFSETLQSCTSLPADQWSRQGGLASEVGEEEPAVVEALLSTRSAFSEVRAMLRLIGESAQVPIEPEQQALVLDQTIAQAGVLFSGVPGAGGYDAIFAVVTGKGSADCVATLWSNLGIIPLGMNKTAEADCGLEFCSTFSLPPHLEPCSPA